MPDLELPTPRLRLLAFTADSAAAAIHDRPRCESLIRAAIPAEWPPIDLADVQEMMAAKLAANPEETGWHGWFVILRAAASPVPAQRDTLIGSVGCGKWGAQSILHFGYGILPAYFRNGYATEAAVALIEWVMRQPGVARVEATTFERHTASLKILDRCGFTCLGVSPDDDKAAESDRQGRGRLMLFARESRG